MAGYSRAVRLGDHIYVAGTTATDESGNVQCEGDATGQAELIIQRIERALNDAGATLSDVVRSRLYVVRPVDAAAVMAVHGRVFSEIRPAATLVIVAGLVDPAMLVEIEVDALLGATDRSGNRTGR
jgi:enamine deaminase RidA (YjgF/YER057c/UK114 family)